MCIGPNTCDVSIGATLQIKQQNEATRLKRENDNDDEASSVYGDSTMNSEDYAYDNSGNWWELSVFFTK